MKGGAQAALLGAESAGPCQAGTGKQAGTAAHAQRQARLPATFEHSRCVPPDGSVPGRRSARHAPAALPSPPASPGSAPLGVRGRRAPAAPGCAAGACRPGPQGRGHKGRWRPGRHGQPPSTLAPQGHTVAHPQVGRQVARHPHPAARVWKARRWRQCTVRMVTTNARCTLRHAPRPRSPHRLGEQAAIPVPHIAGGGTHQPADCNGR